MRIVLTTVLGLGLALAGVVAYSNRNPINRENFERIEVGMSANQVETILGGPATETKQRPYAGSYDPNQFNAAGVAETHLWYSKELTIQVGFGPNGVVVWVGEWLPPVAR